MTTTPRRRARLIFAGMAALVSSGLAVGWGLQAALNSSKQPSEDIGWAIYQLGFEYQRLQLAAETGVSTKELRKRADIYLSRLILLRDAPAYESVRVGIIGQRLNELADTALQIQSDLTELANDPDRRALANQLRDKASLIRNLTQDLSMLNRTQQYQQRLSGAQTVITFIAILEALLVLLLVAGAWLWRINAQLERARQQVERKSADITAIVNAIEDGILGVAADDTVVYCSQRAATLMKWEADSVLGRSLHSLLSPSTLLPVTLALLDQLKHSRHSDHGDQQPLASASIEVDGSHYDLTGVNIPNADATPGSAVRILSIADVTAKRQAQLNRDKYYARLAELSRLFTLATISGGIVHEVSQPLSSIKNYLHLLKNACEGFAFDRDARRYLMSLTDEVERVVETVRNVRRMALDQQSDWGSCDIVEAVQNSVRLASIGMGTSTKIHISLPDRSAQIVGSLPLIGQVLINLISNAAEASHRAGSNQVDVAATHETTQAYITVRDFGTGIDRATADKLFLPFSGNSASGMGLGLAICKRIADNLGAELSWQNMPEGGAAFTFKVPLQVG